MAKIHHLLFDDGYPGRNLHWEKGFLAMSDYRMVYCKIIPIYLNIFHNHPIIILFQPAMSCEIYKDLAVLMATTDVEYAFEEGDVFSWILLGVGETWGETPFGGFLKWGIRSRHHCCSNTKSWSSITWMICGYPHDFGNIYLSQYRYCSMIVNCWLLMA